MHDAFGLCALRICFVAVRGRIHFVHGLLAVGDSEESMLRWSILLVLLLARLLIGDATAAERAAAVTDEGFELHVPVDERLLRVSEAAPDIMEGMRYLQDDKRIRILEMYLTREDIALARKEENVRDLAFRVSRHPISGASPISKASWEDLRPRYRKVVETTMTTENRSLIQEGADEIFNDKMGVDDRIRLDRVERFVAYHEDATSLRFHGFVEVRQGTGDAAQPAVISGFSAAVFIGNRLFMVQGTRNLDTPPSRTTDFEQDRAEFDRFVDRLIELNNDNR